MNTTATPMNDQDREAFNQDIDAHVRGAGFEVTIEAHTFNIQPMRVRQFFPFLKLARPIFAALTSQPSSQRSGLPPDASPTGDGQGGDPIPAAPTPTAEERIAAAFDDSAWVLDMVERFGPVIIEALAVGLSYSKEQLEDTSALEEALGDLQIVDLLTVCRYFIEVNATFFTTRGMRLHPALTANGAAPVAGKTPRARASKSR
jgi:hypothetical protein